MDKLHPPESFGVFKPVGHTVIAFATAAAMENTAAALRAQGFAESALTRYKPEEMVAQVDNELIRVGVMASFGYELAIVKAHRVQALNGCSFLVVQAPHHDEAERVATVAKSHGAVAAQHYSRFLIEEVSGLALGDAPVEA